MLPGVTTPGARFRKLLAGKPFLAGDCYSALTARIVQDVGYPAAYMGGHSTGMMHYAIPDYGVFTTTEMVNAICEPPACGTVVPDGCHTRN